MKQSSVKECFQRVSLTEGDIIKPSVFFFFFFSEVSVQILLIKMYELC